MARRFVICGGALSMPRLCCPALSRWHGFIWRLVPSSFPPLQLGFVLLQIWQKRFARPESAYKTYRSRSRTISMNILYKPRSFSTRDGLSGWALQNCGCSTCPQIAVHWHDDPFDLRASPSLVGTRPTGARVHTVGLRPHRPPGFAAVVVR